MAKQLRITVEGKTYDVTVETVGEAATVTRIAAAAPAPAAPAAAPAPAPAPAPLPPQAAPAAAGANDIVAPLAAVVVSVDVKVGQAVKAGDKVVTIEAMKMNTIVSATSAGTVKAIHVAAGQSVQEGQPLLAIG
ncbi:MAG: acetyl-CoA carboxylase biotin carboxyl carrier protein subunit [Puniceicoccales bacterium]|jgi:biotin carboxyl carrier protein|nr:acetyl-CoA carboxylase biotin carboxyl carrier protein subunit [Puniceicoccales bacterium]